MTPLSVATLDEDEDTTTQAYDEMEVFTRSSGHHISTAVSFPTVSPSLGDSASHTLGYTLGLNTSLSISPTLSAALASLSSTMPQGSAVTTPTTVHHLTLEPSSEQQAQSAVVLLDNPDVHGMLGPSFSENTALGDDVISDPDVYSAAVDMPHSL